MGMMDDGDVLLADRSHRIGLAVEFDGEVGVETALEVNGQVQVQEGGTAVGRKRERFSDRARCQASLGVRPVVRQT